MIRFVVAVGLGCLACSTSGDARPASKSSGLFAASGSLSTTRRTNQLVALGDGRVLLVGGFSFPTKSTAEVWDPTSGTWSATGPFADRQNPSVTLLADGRVLVAGGWQYSAGYINLASATLYSPTTNNFTAAPPMAVMRANHAAVRLADGRVLVTGGSVEGTATFHASAEIYDPAKNEWASTAPMAGSRLRHAAVLLPSGKVLIAGGDASAKTTEIFDAATGTWSAGPTSALDHKWPIAALLPTGKVLIGDGNNDGKCELYDPVSNTLSPTGSIGTHRNNPAWLQIAPGRILVTGGSIVGTHYSSAEMYDAATGVFTYAGVMGARREDHGIAAISGGRALIAGGFSSESGSLSTAEIYQPGALGASCTAAGECASGACSDGVCCSTACLGQCEACDVLGKVGTCSPVTGATRGTRAKCSDGAGDPCKAQSCDGVDPTKCAFASVATKCGADSCRDGVETHEATCTGSGACGDTPKSCGAYACGATACKSACTTVAECIAGHYCAGGMCLKIAGLGEPCLGALGCTEGLFCTDGVCCGLASCGTGSSCSAGAVKGQCAKTLGATCGDGRECGSGHCVDNVCCETACSGVCEACDAAGSRGKCVPIAGVPHGTREACPFVATDPCSKSLCDGTTSGTCAALPGADVTCRGPRCREGSVEAEGKCDGMGGCGKGTTATCGGFICAADGRACRTSCKDNAECLEDHDCVDGACRPRAGTCDPGGTSVSEPGREPRSCAPYVCRDGRCRTSCESSTDCSAGLLCDVSLHACTPIAAEADTGGCSSGRSSRATFGVAAAMVALVLSLRRRRVAIAIAIATSTIACSPSEPIARGFEVSLPAHAAGPVQLNHAGRAITIEALDLDALRGEDVPSGRVYRSPDLDVLHVRQPERFEELRVLRKTTDRALMRYRVRGASLHLVGAIVEAADATGRPLFRTEPAFAIDAHGERRAATVSVTGDVVTFAFDLKGVVPPITLDPAWVSAGALNAARLAATLSTLASGKLLLAGGTAGTFTDHRSSAEVFDPATKTWSTTASMATPRASHTAVVLASGKVLVAGGATTGGVRLSSVEIYDPSAGTWAPAASMGVARAQHAAALLPSGKVLVHGGTTGAFPLKSAEIYDPASDKWTAAPDTGWGHERHAAIRLLSGKILVAGGDGGFKTAELYDEATGAWTSAGSTDRYRYDVTAVMFPSGKVLLVGDSSGAAPTMGEVYDPLTNTWSNTLPHVVPRMWPRMGLLGDGRALLTGGFDGKGDTAIAEIYDPATNAWVHAGSMAYARSRHLTATLPGGSVLVATGGVGLTLLATEIFAPAPNGDPCVSVGECASKLCVDGRCCDTACGGQCEACDVAGKLGTCSPRAGAPRAPRAACSDGAGDVCRVEVCDGVDRSACHLRPAGSVACGANGCTGGVETHVSTCKSDGTCADVPKSCGAYACGAVTCRATCATSDDCAKGFKCSGGACTSAGGAGSPCKEARDCSFGLFCTDGACCTSAICAAGSSCAKGTCAKLDGTSCASAMECASSICADGVCCDRACDGRCEACDVPGSDGRRGRCTPVRGAPHGSRDKCPTDATNVCASRVCDGKDPASCAGWVGADVVCRDVSCASAVESSAAVCDGAGVCAASTTVECGGYACDLEGKACRTSCASSADCAPDYECRFGSCRRRATRCSDDGLSAIDSAGGAKSCAPYKCLAGACIDRCGTSEDCVSGTACDPATRACVGVGGATSEPAGGCTIAKPSPPSALFFVALLLLRPRRRATRSTQPNREVRPS